MKSTDLKNLLFHRLPSSALYAGVLLGCLSLAAGCSDDEDPGAAAGAACTTSKDCQSELVCRDLVCVPIQPGSDAGDTSDEDTDGEDTEQEEKIEAADYFISYLLEDLSAGTKYLHVRSTADGQDYQLGDAEHACDRGCWLTEDMKYYAWAKLNADPSQGLDLHAVEVVDFALQGAGELIESGVSGISVAGNGMTYSKDGTSYYRDLSPGSTAREIAVIGAGEGPTGGWYVDPGADVAFAYAPTLDTLELKVGAFTNPQLESVYTLNGVNYAGGAGSFYGSSMPVAVSPDGKLLAFIVKAPNDYQECATASDCGGPIKICGANNICSVLELTVHFLDMDNLETLGGECASNSDCGGIHQCYQSGPEAIAECIPGRVVVGVPDTPYQRPVPGETPRSGCDLSADDETYHYTVFGSPISFDNAGNLYGVARRDCSGEGLVGDSDIIKVDPRAKNYQVVWGNPDSGFDADSCWNNTLAIPDITNCSPYMTEAILSPDRNDIAIVATNPNVDREQFAKENYDLWRVLRNGKEHDWIGGYNISESVERIAVHPAP